MATKQFLTSAKDAAQKALAARRKRFKDAPSFDNSALYAGSPMYYRCIGCGDPKGVEMPESWLPPRRELCMLCAEMKARGWLE